ncbi:MAG: hypothetical protein ACFFE4_10180 [Candidatus Thorarchaeota archaeon]
MENFNTEQSEKERLEKEKLEKERLEKEQLEKERLEKERFEKLKMENKLYPCNSLFMIPSWGDLLGYPTLGKYAHHQVSKIISDTVVFFAGYDYSIEIERGTLHYLFGLGFFSLKFELETGKYITDNRILTGLILSDFVYDHMVTSPNVTLEDDEEVVIAEKVIKVPLDLSYKSENHKTFIKGVLMRNIFIPHKDVFLELMETIRNSDTYQVVKDGHMLLSTHWDFFNQILVSNKIKEKSDLTYLESVAGLDGIVFEADQQLEEMLSQENLRIIENKITSLKSVYSNLDFDPMYLFSIFENASAILSPEVDQISPQQPELTKKKSSKHSIFASAEDRLYAFASWPIQFKRKAKIQPIVPPEIEKHHSYLKQTADQVTEVKIKPTPEADQEKFEIDTLKTQKVEFKPLPDPPEADIKHILRYLRKVLEGDFEMRSIGHAFEVARERMRQLGVSATTTHQAKIWEMSKYANIYVKKESYLGLPLKEKQELIQKVDSWVFEIEEEERKERERLEKIRLERERREREERERQERERREKLRQEQERQEREKIERERLAQEKAEEERLEKIERAKQEEIRLERERIEKERAEIEAVEKEKRELERLKQERKLKEKEAKQEAKKRKKLEKQKKKIEKKKQKEQERLDNL